MVKVFDWILVVSFVGSLMILLIAEFYSVSLAMGLAFGVLFLTGLQILDTLWKQEKQK